MDLNSEFLYSPILIEQTHNSLLASLASILLKALSHLLSLIKFPTERNQSYNYTIQIHKEIGLSKKLFFAALTCNFLMSFSYIKYEHNTSSS